MIRHCSSRRRIYSLGFVLLAAGILALYSRAARAGQEAQQGQQQQGKTDQSQGQGQGQSQEKQKKKGGFLSGVKAITGSGQEQTSATASAGTKGVDEDGQTIANVTPTAADQKAVAAMDSYSLPQGALPKFIEGGHLKPKQ